MPLASACEVAEVTTPPTERTLVVEAILLAGASRQKIILHRPLAGPVVQGEPGARVSVVTPEGTAVVFEESHLDACTSGILPKTADPLRVEATCYTTPESQPLNVRPGATYQLEIVTADGRRVRGRTTVPGSFQLRSPASSEGGEPVCALPPLRSLRLVWSMAEGTWSYLATIRIQGLEQALAGTGINVKDPVELTGLAVSQRDTVLVVPTDFGVIDLLFQLADIDRELLQQLQRGFPDGVSVRLAIAAGDRNYVNGIWRGSFNPSGATRISSVVGDGIGVFGSVVAREMSIVVGTDLPYPPCLSP